MSTQRDLTFDTIRSVIHTLTTLMKVVDDLDGIGQFIQNSDSQAEHIGRATWSYRYDALRRAREREEATKAAEAEEAAE